MGLEPEEESWEPLFRNDMGVGAEERERTNGAPFEVCPQLPSGLGWALMWRRIEDGGWGEGLQN